MLERLNDVQAALETARNNAKRAESRVAELEQRCTVLQKEKDALSSKPNDSDKLKRELSDVKEELALVSSDWRPNLTPLLILILAGTRRAG